MCSPTSLPVELWVKVLDACDPVSYVRVISSSKFIPKDATQYNMKKDEYFILKSKVVLKDPVRNKYGSFSASICNGLGSPIIIQTPLVKMPSVVLNEANKYELKLDLNNLDPQIGEFMKAMDNKMGEFVRKNFKN